jgi:hypothetical protein
MASIMFGSDGKVQFTAGGSIVFGTAGQSCCCGTALCYIPLVCGTNEPASFGVPVAVVTARLPMYFKLPAGSTVYYIPRGATPTTCPEFVENTVIEVKDCDGTLAACCSCYKCCISNLSWAICPPLVFSNPTGEAEAAALGMPDEIPYRTTDSTCAAWDDYSEPYTSTIEPGETRRVYRRLQASCPRVGGSDNTDGFFINVQRQVVPEPPPADPWDSEVSYAFGDWVSYGGSTWFSEIDDNLGNTPGTGGEWSEIEPDPPYWEDLTPATIYRLAKVSPLTTTSEECCEILFNQRTTPAGGVETITTVGATIVNNKCCDHYDYPLWSSATTYALGDRVSYSVSSVIRGYISIQAGNLNQAPDGPSGALYWTHDDCDEIETDNCPANEDCSEIEI